MNDLIKYDAARNWISLTMPEDISEEEWLGVGDILGRINHCNKWNLGEWLRLGNRKWGKTYDEAVKRGFSYQTAADAVWMAGEFPLSRRRDKLTWSHHKEVAGLDAAVADRFLDDAVNHKWSRQALREQVSDFKKVQLFSPARKTKPAVFTLDEPEVKDTILSQTGGSPDFGVKGEHSEPEVISPKRRTPVFTLDEPEVISPEIPPTPPQETLKNITPSKTEIPEEPNPKEPEILEASPRNGHQPETEEEKRQRRIKELEQQLKENDDEVKTLKKEIADLQKEILEAEALEKALKKDLSEAEKLGAELKHKLMAEHIEDVKSPFLHATEAHS